MSAKDRLESLMLARRSASDLTIMNPKSVLAEERDGEGSGSGAGATRLKVRLPRAEVEKLLKDCKDEAEAAERIMGLYMNKTRESTVCENDHGKEKEKKDIIKSREVRVTLILLILNIFAKVTIHETSNLVNFLVIDLFIMTKITNSIY